MWPADPSRVRPMLASIGSASLISADLVYEPKYDGIRALIAVEPAPHAKGARRGPARVRIWSRLGNDKGRQFPEIVQALGEAFATRTRPLLLDGELVAVNDRGAPISFLHLQGRIHIPGTATRRDVVAPVAFIAFDLLFDGDLDLRAKPLHERRATLERAFRPAMSTLLRLSEQATGDGRALDARARREGWEGLVAKRRESRYASAARSRDWVKLKRLSQQTCVIGGWTAPKGTRTRFGALLLGVFDNAGRLVHVGQVGTGFSGAELDRVWAILQRHRRATSPFAEVPASLARSHWVTPTLTCEVTFTEWTLDGKLRHPVYVGLRDDVTARAVRREPTSTRAHVSANAPARSAAPTKPATRPTQGRQRADKTVDVPSATALSKVMAQLEHLQAEKGHGTLALPGGATLAVTNLSKVFWPALKLTKGDLFQHYVRVASAILPVLADRPLVLQRYPNGVDGKPFYQHRAAERIPNGVRAVEIESSDGRRPYLVGGTLLALLYASQLAAISQDPWFSRVGNLDHIDAIAIDIDPPDGTPVRRTLDAALWVRDECAAVGATAFVKTSGSRGLHVFIRMPEGTSYEVGVLYAQILATLVASKHPRQTTVERSVRARGGRIYLDYLQNIRGKTLASAYSVRATPWAGVSTPLTWDEVSEGIDPKDFTLRSIATRLAAVGDLWAGLRRSRPADPRAITTRMV